MKTPQLNLITSYRNYFMSSQRVSSKCGKKAMVLDPQQWNKFFNHLKSDVLSGNVELEFAAAISLSTSTGLRVGELTSIKVSMIDLDTGAVKDIPVLKKRGKLGDVVRQGQLHPLALEIVKMYLQAHKKRPSQFFTKLDRQMIDRKIKKLFGLDFDHHSLARHSFVSLLVENKFEGMKIASIMKLESPNMAYRYVHTAVARDLQNLFKAA